MLTVVVLLGFWGGQRNVTDDRTQAGQVADVLLAEAKPGDAVVYCPDQLGPAVDRLLSDRKGLVQVTFPRGGSPKLIDWVDYRNRVARTDPAKFAANVLGQVGADKTVWYVENPSYEGYVGKCEGLAAALSQQRPGAVTRVVGDDQDYEGESLIQFPGS
jgi:mannosyltransferase